MGDLIVIAGALFGALVIAAGLGWFVPRLRRRFAGQRTGTSAGPLPGVGLVLTGLVLVAVSLGVFSDSAKDSATGDIAATCDLLEGGDENFNVEGLDRLAAVAPPDVAVHVRTVRDRFAAVGDAAFEEEAVVTSFNAVESFKAEECSA